jgi:hypothetical protein
VIPGPRPPGGDHRPPGSRGEAPDDDGPAERRPVPVLFPPGVLAGPAGGPAALVVRTARGWAVLGGARPGPAHDEADELTLVEAMTLADLVAGELGTQLEPDRASRRSARATPPPAEDAAGPDGTPDPRDHEIATLRRTVGQLEHALAARVSIERAIGALAERHGTSPREAFEELRGRARSQGRPATELAGEVLAALAAGPGPDGDEPAPRPADAPSPQAQSPQAQSPQAQSPQARSPQAVPPPEQARGHRSGPGRPDAVPEAQS